MADSNILLVHQIQDRIIEIIKNSKEFCFLVTPFYQPWTILNRELEKAARQEKKIVFILRNTDENRFNCDSLNYDYGFDVVFVDRLHTKLYLNECEALISSMNLYESSKDNNYELGYYFGNRTQAKNLKEAVIDNDILMGDWNILRGRYFNNYESPKNQRFDRENIQDSAPRNLGDNGFCIRCGEPIPLDPARPLCDECFKSWSQWNNYGFYERFCHICRKDYGHSFGISPSYNNPVCFDCRKNHNVEGYNKTDGGRCYLKTTDFF